MEVNYNILILCGICIFFLIVNAVQMWQNAKRERELFDRLLLSNEEYLNNRVRMSLKTEKTQYIGEIDADKTGDELSVD